MRYPSELYPQYEEFKDWDEFLKRWPLEKVKNMTLEEYSNLDREDSYTYWLESKTSSVISIWGGSSYKFGVFKRNQSIGTDNLKASQKSDGEYGWYAKYGDSAEEAFEKVKNLIVKVIECALQKNFSCIDDIDLGHAYKWKIAFMYAEPGSIPGIVSDKALKKLAIYHECSYAKTSKILKCLLDKKPGNQDFWEYTQALWKEWEEHSKEETESFEIQERAEHKIVYNKNYIKNIILYGPPGTGKTVNYRRIIDSIESGQSIKNIFDLIKENSLLESEYSDYNKAEDEGRVRFVTFHQNFSYEDFIEGFRPNTSGGIKLEKGIFKEICEKAQESDQHHYLIIDEINRGNISKIFGELITLIEEDKRGKLTVTLPYSKEPFTVPENLYIIATMNSTDKSIALIDVALRRRFTFVKMMPNPDLVENEEAKTMMVELNKFITEKLGEDFQIGHSYFITDDLEFAIDYKIVPLLEEYFFADAEGLKEAKRIVGREENR